MLKDKVSNNAWLFLRRAIQELNNHDDENDEGLSEECAIMATSFIQVSFELSLVAYFLKVDGIHGIVKNGDINNSEEVLINKFENNELITKSFNTLKNEAFKRRFIIKDEHEYTINDFQKIRNKLMHMSYYFDEGELYDLKYDLIYFLVQVLIPTLVREEIYISEAISLNIQKKDFNKLISFTPYAHEMNEIAKKYADNVYNCIHCGNDSLGDDYCYSCCSDLSLSAGFIDCPYCKSKSSMIYDALNIKDQPNQMIKGLCLKCKEDDVIYLCPKCESETAIEGNIGDKRCGLDFCQYNL